MFDLIAEQKIAEAIARGELDNLPGAGRPLNLDDDALIPEELRLAYRILKNAGYVPPDGKTQRLPVFSYSAIAFFRSLYSLQLKKQSLSSWPRCSLALATLPTIR